MTGPEHERFSDDVGAYLLGALSEIEARAYERHTAVCPECRDELDRLRPAAEAIARSAEQFEAPSSLKKSLMGTVKAEARGRRAGARAPLRSWFPSARLATAAAALALAGVAIGLAIEGGGGGSSRRVVAADVRGLPGSAQLEVVDGRPSALRVAGLPVLRGGRVYEVWIEHHGSVRPAGALFAVGSDGRGAAAVPGAVKGDRVLVTRERAGGAARPSETPVISASA